MTAKISTFRLALALLGIALVASAADAAQHNFYVTVDGRPLATGTYAGLENPNLGRLTLLYAHWDVDHFHGIGVYSYTGTPPAHGTLPTNANNRLPETIAGQAPLTLQPGAGPFAGKLVSGENGEHYSDLSLYSIHDLAADATADPTSPEGLMYNSNAGYKNTPMTGLNLALEIVALSPGLKLGAGGLETPGATLPIGGEASLPFEPVFWTDATAAPGAYSASMRLVDLSGAFQPSGTFHYDFAVVPEPSCVALLLVGSAAVLAACRCGRRS